jgi:dTDP-4-amino-4,6-dideoxygalactose transaminase
MKILLMRPFMPDKEEFEPYLDRIWESRQLTNDGQIHSAFEETLCRHLGVQHICLFANGTLALIAALKALGMKGEVITTPFTSVSTLQAIYWNNLKPVFADISRRDLNIHPENIEAAITSNTCCILPVHVFGNPCDVDGISELAGRYQLKTVYDAAHCFGVKVNGIPLCNSGDLSVLSFHATKVFNSIEGGAIICHDPAMKARIDALKMFRYDRPLDNPGCGLNAKMNEFQAAFGMVQLKHVAQVIKMRKEATLEYLKSLAGIKGIDTIPCNKKVEHNYAYFPILVNAIDYSAGRDDLAIHLEKKGISTRKYFHPLVSDFPEFSRYKTVDLPIAKDMAERILCLPLYHDISLEEINYISDSIKQLSGGV